MTGWPQRTLSAAKPVHVVKVAGPSQFGWSQNGKALAQMAAYDEAAAVHGVTRSLR